MTAWVSPISIGPELSFTLTPQAVEAIRRPPQETVTPLACPAFLLTFGDASRPSVRTVALDHDLLAKPTSSPAASSETSLCARLRRLCCLPISDGSSLCRLAVTVQISAPALSNIQVSPVSAPFRVGRGAARNGSWAFQSTVNHCPVHG